MPLAPSLILSQDSKRWHHDPPPDPFRITQCSSLTHPLCPVDHLSSICLVSS
ncbi:hypothetical protein L207DRAFT_154852 [Hyaloscypha variabilis F]|uniref:Uncharacterized protein n=1 Tax=Hyaloscypha variabilis (strain UAMH 11265 / GT02V1 / F) TaxID=1149755 RepID=A0A2J6S9A1_HYAVF|nr:hypothetical protein L207DRAFT_154852 [Hyaloscypha variabilis F]